MLDRALQWAYARWGARYPKTALAIQFQLSHVIVLAGVERVTRTTGREMLITQATHALLDSHHGGFEECGREQLKGKTEEVRLYSPVVLGVADYSSTPAATRAAATSE